MATTMSPVFEAKYRGLCGVCDDRIAPGDLVRYEDNELVHSEHAGLVQRPALRSHICGRCFQEMPLVGGCENCG